MNRVIVHDIDSLESYMEVLRSKKEELEQLFGTLEAETGRQGSNWQDPQYEYLKERMENCCSSCRTQLDGLDESIRYIGALIAKLRAL